MPQGSTKRRHCLAFSLAALAFSCVAPDDERIHCDDTGSFESATFAQVKALIADEDKGCSAANCHGADEAAHGYRFDADAAIYDALTTHMDSVYPLVATGDMPEDGVRWNEQDLLLLRTWYCNGAFPNE